MRHVDMIMCMHAMRRDVHMQHAMMQHARMRSQHRCMHVDQATDRLSVKLKLKGRKAQSAKRAAWGLQTRKRKLRACVCVGAFHFQADCSNWVRKN